MPADLLEIGELRHLHAVAPDLPAEPPGAERGALPVILDKADVMERRVDADGLQRAEIEILQIGRRGFDEHLILIVMLQSVGVLAIAPVGGPPRGLHIGRGPGARPQRAQRGGGVKGARAHLHVVGLQDGTAAPGPVGLKPQDDLLKAARFCSAVRHAMPPNATSLPRPGAGRGQSGFLGREPCRFTMHRRGILLNLNELMPQAGKLARNTAMRLITALCLVLFTAPMAALGQATTDPGRQVFIQIESQPTLAEARARAQAYARQLPDVNGFSVGRGWYGIALGPYRLEEAARVLDVYRREGRIARDSYIADTDDYGRRFWPAGRDRRARGRAGRPPTRARAPTPSKPYPSRNRPRPIRGARERAPPHPRRARRIAGGAPMGRVLSRPDRRGLRARHPRRHVRMAAGKRVRADRRADHAPARRAFAPVHRGARGAWLGGGARHPRRDRDRPAARRGGV